MKATVRAARRLRELRMVAWAVAHKDHPILAQLVVIRRCNLACAYCNEYDKTSDPVAPELLERRIDALATLGTSIITLTGGEPTLHPQLDDLIRRVRRRGMLAGLITNGFFLMPERIRQLNDAGLDHMQISIDNVEPDEVSMKSLKHLDRKLGYLAVEAAFHVNINSVLGAGTRATDVLRINRRAEELGFSTSTGVLHDGQGQLKPLGPDELAVWQTVRGRAGTSWARLRGFEENLVDGRANDWRCRAGARYLYVCEDGLVHYCSQRRGEPGIPVVDYTVEDVRRAFREVKTCAPYCTLGCVHRVSMVDAWRA
jgi:MoaA/NifB/PqqE/SkfB family radical SAM enzyme